MQRFDLAVEMVADELDLPIDEPFTVVMPSDTGSWCGKSSRACYIEELDVVVVKPGLEQTAVHELVHAMTFRNGLAAPKFLEEGRAQFLGGPFASGDSGFPDTRCFDAGTIAPPFSKQAIADANDYDGVAAHFSGYVLSLPLGGQWFETLGRNHGYGLSNERLITAFESATGTSMSSVWDVAFDQPVTSPYGCVAQSTSLPATGGTIDFDLTDDRDSVEFLFAQKLSETTRRQILRLELPVGETYIFEAGSDAGEWVAEVRSCSCVGSVSRLGPSAPQSAVTHFVDSPDVTISFSAPEGAKGWIRLSL